jgi:hypothetical protein
MTKIILKPVIIGQKKSSADGRAFLFIVNQNYFLIFNTSHSTLRFFFLLDSEVLGTAGLVSP